MAQNQQILLIKRPNGKPTLDCFKLHNEAIPTPSDGQFLLQNHVISMDAGVRGFLDEVSRYGDYVPPVPLGSPVMGMTLGKVIKSRHPNVQEGQFVRSMARWEEYSLLDNALGLEIVEPKPAIQLRHYMGLLGPVGLTAWVGLRIIGEVQAGESVVVSAAAGATGNAAGQIAKLLGARVIGLAGGVKKGALLKDTGFDEAIDYHATDDVGDAVKQHCPDGVQLFFDNVGGQVLEQMLPAMADHGRIVNCGMIADYNNADNPHGVRSLWQIVLKRLSLRGFMMFDHMDRVAEAQAQLDDWVLTEQLKIRETVYTGIAQTPQAFVALLTGQTTGKTLVELAVDSQH